MTSWTEPELAAIDRASELRVAGARADGSLRRLVTVWQVRVGHAIYIRSVYGATGGWYRGTRDQGHGRIESGGVVKDVDSCPTPTTTTMSMRLTA